MKKRSKKRYITFDYKKEKEFSEIDFDLYDEMGHDYEEERIEIRKEENIKGGNGNWIGESHPIKIDRMIAFFKNLKKSGCNYAEIKYHTDHIGYVVNGLEVRLSTKDEIKEKEEELLEGKKKWEEIQKLRDKIEEVKKR